MPTNPKPQPVDTDVLLAYAAGEEAEGYEAFAENLRSAAAELVELRRLARAVAQMSSLWCTHEVLAAYAAWKALRADPTEPEQGT